MIPTDFSTFWTTLGPAAADHLWQSTLFAAAAALLTLALHKNQARTRFWIWLAASLKFLVPFAPLIAIGKRFSWLRGASPAQAGVYVTIEDIGQPFTRPMARAIGASAAPHHFLTFTSLFPATLILLWLAGSIAVLAIWCVRWRRISAAIRQSTLMHDGSELEILRRLESASGMTTQIPLLCSATTLEPGIFGAFRPVLLWPKRISERLTPHHLEAVLAHELCHVRRRDNLAAAIHMLVESLFWFHPLVWWMGARLIDERERACDEQVLELGGQREVYAESILKVCEFCVGSPLACVAGVTGSDLKKRMVHIMSEHIGRKLDFSRKLLITTAAVLAIAIPVVFGLFDATPSRAQTDAAAIQNFQSFSIKPSQNPNPESTYAGSGRHMVKMMAGPDEFFAVNITMATLIQQAYGVEANQLAGGPDWLNTDRFDAQGKVDNPQTSSVPGPEAFRSKIQPMLRAGLAESTKLAVHTEAKDISTYALVVAEGGSKLQPAQLPNDAGGGRGVIGMRRMTVQKGSGDQVVGLAAQGISVADFASQLSRQLGAPVVDETNLKGNYNFNLQWAAERAEKLEAEAKMKQAANAANDTSESGNAATQAISTALEQQLGLKLVPQTQLMPVVVIDHIEKPAEN